MSSKISCGLKAFRLLALCELTLSAMVLPRPPSSPNEILRETIHGDDGKFGIEKTFYSLVRVNTVVEKPNTDGYRLLQIELDGADEADGTSVGGLVRAMLRGEEEERTNLKNERGTYPNPEVIPNSILGVRDIDTFRNYRIHPFADEHKERTLLRPPNGPGLDEKLYYMKNTRPKVDVRGHGRSPPGTIRNTKSLVDKRIPRPKKYQPLTNRDNINDDDNDRDYSSNGRIYGTNDYETRTDGENDESTTENMSVTSSELPKQIPAPPRRLPSRPRVAQTTPVQKYYLQRTDILSGHSYGEA